MHIGSIIDPDADSCRGVNNSVREAVEMQNDRRKGKRTRIVGIEEMEGATVNFR